VADLSTALSHGKQPALTLSGASGAGASVSADGSPGKSQSQRLSPAEIGSALFQPQPQPQSQLSQTISLGQNRGRDNGRGRDRDRDRGQTGKVRHREGRSESPEEFELVHSPKLRIGEKVSHSTVLYT